MDDPVVVRLRSAHRAGRAELPAAVRDQADLADWRWRVHRGPGQLCVLQCDEVPEPGLGGGRLRGALPPLLADRPVRGRIHRPLVAAADPGLVGRAPRGVRGPDCLAGGLGQPGRPAVRQRPGGARRRQVLPVLAVSGAAARRGGRQAGHGQLRVTDRRGDHGIRRGPRRPRRAPGDRQRPDRVGRYLAGLRVLLPGSGTGGRHHAPRIARPGPRPGRLAARPGAHGTRRRGGRPGRRGPLCLAPPQRHCGAGRDRSEPAPLRDLVPDVDPAVPELFLSRGRRERRTRQLFTAHRRVGGRLRVGRASHAGGDQAAGQASLDRRPARHGRRRNRAAGRDIQPARVPDHRFRGESGLPGSGHLRDHDHPGGRRRCLPWARLLLLRHDVQCHLRGRGRPQRGLHARDREIVRRCWPSWPAATCWPPSATGRSAVSRPGAASAEPQVRPAPRPPPRPAVPEWLARRRAAHARAAAPAGGRRPCRPAGRD